MGTPGARKAIESLGQALGSAQRHIRLSGPSGVGKSLVLEYFLQALRSPWVQIVSVSGNQGELGALGQILHAMKGSHSLECEPEKLWNQITLALRLAQLQRKTVVLAIDDAEAISGTCLIPRLSTLCQNPGTAATVIEVIKTPILQGVDLDPDSLAYLDQTAYSIALRPLTRTDAVFFINTKYSNSSGNPLFSESAITAIHHISQGLPRRIDRLAASALRVASLQNSGEVEATLVHEVSRILGS